MWPLSAAAAATIRRSHQIAIRATAYTTTQGPLVFESVTDGSVTCDGKSQVRRTATVDIAQPAQFPDLPEDALSPLGSRMLLEYGIVVPRVGIEWIPTITGPIQSAQAGLVRAAPGTRKRVAGLSVNVSDPAQAVADDRLAAPLQTIDGALVVDEIARIITQTMPDAVVLDRTGGSTTVAPTLTIEKDRWQDGIEKLADAAAVEVFADPLGRFVIRPTPTLNDPPVWRINAGSGDEPGVLVRANLKRTRDQVYNAVVVRGDSTSGTTPVSVLVVDDDPASPTRWGGPFGRKLRYYTSPLITDSVQGKAVGQSLLDRVRGFSTTVEISAVPNPALEPGDVLEVDLGDGLVQRHIIDQVPIPMKPGEQSLTTRTSTDLPAEQ